jgi:ABC-2 type transport system permease protein
MSFGNFKFVWALFTTNLKSVTALRGSFLLSMIFMALNNATFLVFWWVLFGRVGGLRGWQGPEVLLLFGVSAAGFGIMAAVAGGALHLSRFIDEGALEPLLTQPKPTLLYALGCRSQASGFGDFLSGIAFIALSGYLRWSTVPLVIFGVLASAVIFTATCVLLFSLAFWLHRTHTLSRQLLDITITFSLYPEPLFGGGLRLVLFTVIPAGFVGYLPASLVRTASVADAALLGFGCLAYGWLALRVFRSGLSRYSSGSRFGIFG